MAPPFKDDTGMVDNRKSNDDNRISTYPPTSVTTTGNEPSINTKSKSKYDNVPNVTEARWKEIQEKFPHFPINKDILADRKEAFIRLPSFLEEFVVKYIIYDKRDAIMGSLIMNILCTTVPLTILLFNYPSHLLGVFSMVFTYFMYLQRFILMMHYAEHRKLFKEPYHSVLQYLLPCVICPFFGMPPGMYRLHHVIMHHIENNVFNEDLSSTEPYQRDNFFHFLIYYGRYYCALFTLPVYAIRKGRYKMAIVALTGSLTWLSLIYYGLQTHYIFTIWFGLAPGLITGLALMFGNFSQHIFVHPNIATMKQNLKSYEFNCALSLQSINHFDNQYAFNDGYHVTHHINSRIHWTDMPSHFMKNLEKYAENDALVFQQVGFFDIGLHVFLGWWDALADHYVHLTKEKISKEEVIKKLKLRLKPINRTNRLVRAEDTDDAADNKKDH